MNCLDGCDTYWSCAGHEDYRGQIAKLPRVWFYTRSVVFPRLIQLHLTNLSIQEKLHFTWHVQVTFSDLDNPDTGFSIEPDAVDPSTMSLKKLHRDIAAIAENLVPNIQTAAAKMLKDTRPTTS